jgi:hypothetical protein
MVICILFFIPDQWCMACTRIIHTLARQLETLTWGLHSDPSNFLHWDWVVCGVELNQQPSIQSC